MIDCHAQSVLQLNPWLPPIQDLPRETDVGLPLQRIVRWQRKVLDPRTRSRQLNHLLRNLSMSLRHRVRGVYSETSADVRGLGGLIHAAVGSASGVGRPWTKRSGRAA